MTNENKLKTTKISDEQEKDYKKDNKRDNKRDNNKRNVIYKCYENYASANKMKIVLLAVFMFISYFLLDGIYMTVHNITFVEGYGFEYSSWGSHIFKCIRYLLISTVILLLPYEKWYQSLYEKIMGIILSRLDEDELQESGIIGYSIILCINVLLSTAAVVLTSPLFYQYDYWSRSAGAFIVYVICLISCIYRPIMAANDYTSTIKRIILIAVDTVFIFISTRQFILTLIMIVALVLSLFVMKIFEGGKRNLLSYMLIGLLGIAVAIVMLFATKHVNRLTNWFTSGINERLFFDGFMHIKRQYGIYVSAEYLFSTFNTYFGTWVVILILLLFAINSFLIFRLAFSFGRKNYRRMSIFVGVYMLYFVWFIYGILTDIGFVPAVRVSFLATRYTIPGLMLMLRCLWVRNVKKS